MLKTPYLLFLGDVSDRLSAKTAFGIIDWRPEHCIGQISLPECGVNIGLDELSLREAWEKGARTLVVGIANRGGFIEEKWTQVFLQAIAIGYDLAAGLHMKLRDIPALRDAAKEKGCAIHDVRYPSGPLECGTGNKRAGKRLLTVGTDCSVGKMYTSLAIEREMRQRGMDTDFRATGQTGILITGGGISVDAVVSDFISGATEALAPINRDNHWDIIEGQGSLFHPSFAGVSLGLLHGSQPDALVLCHEPTRTTMRGISKKLPELKECMDLNLTCAKLTNPAVRFVGISINTFHLSDEKAAAYMSDVENKYDLPTVDPIRNGVSRLIGGLQDA